MARVPTSRPTDLRANSDRPRSGVGIARGLTPDKILEAMESVVAMRGLAAFRVQDVADELKVKPQAIYNYFDGREALIRALSEKFAAELAEASLASEGKDPWTRVTASARKLAAYLYAKPTAAYLVLLDSGQWGLTEAGSARDIDDALQRRVTRFIEGGIKSGDFAKIRPVTYMAYLVTGIAANIIWSNHHRPGNVPLSVIQREAERLAHGLLTPRPAPDVTGPRGSSTAEARPPRPKRG